MNEFRMLVVAATLSLIAPAGWASMAEAARGEASRAQNASITLAGGLASVSGRVTVLEEGVEDLESRLADLEAQPDQDTLAELSCTDGQVVKWSAAAAAWICASLPESPAAAEKVVFATSTAFQGQNLGGVVGADRICTQSANQAGLPGQFRAWLSDSVATSPVGRFAPSAGPYVLTNGAPVANNWADLTDCTKGADNDACLSSPINLDENAREVFHARIWTGTATDGTLAETVMAAKRSATCNDWQVDLDSGNFNDGIAGRPGVVTALWTNAPVAGIICQDPQIFGGLYCFQQ